MNWHFSIVFLIFLPVFVNAKFTIEDAHCNQEAFNLEHTISLGVVTDWIVQITVNLQLIMYPHRSNEYLTLYNGSGDRLDTLYPGIKNFRTFQHLEQLSPDELLSKVSFGGQRSENVIKIYSYIYKKNEISYFQQQFDSKIGPTETLGAKTDQSIIKLISLWTTNTDSKLLNDNTKMYNYHLASVEGSDTYSFYWTVDLNYYQGFTVCYDGTKMKKANTCPRDNKDWINSIRFGFFFRYKIYFVSVVEKKIWSIDEQFVIGQEFSLVEENYETFFNCKYEASYIPDRNSTNSTLIPEPVKTTTKYNWKTLVLIIILLFILIIIFVVILQLIPGKKHKKDRKKRRRVLSSWYSS